MESTEQNWYITQLVQGPLSNQLGQNPFSLSGPSDLTTYAQGAYTAMRACSLLRIDGSQIKLTDDQRTSLTTNLWEVYARLEAMHLVDMVTATDPMRQSRQDNVVMNMLDVQMGLGLVLDRASKGAVKQRVLELLDEAIAAGEAAPLVQVQANGLRERIEGWRETGRTNFAALPQGS